MITAYVKMKDGREIVGPIWVFNAIHGYMTIPSQTYDLLYFREMALAVERTEHETGLGVDLLERARKQGWNGT